MSFFILKSKLSTKILLCLTFCTTATHNISVPLHEPWANRSQIPQIVNNPVVTHLLRQRLVTSRGAGQWTLKYERNFSEKQNHPTLREAAQWANIAQSKNWTKLPLGQSKQTFRWAWQNTPAYINWRYT